MLYIDVQISIYLQDGTRFFNILLGKCFSRLGLVCNQVQCLAVKAQLMEYFGDGVLALVLNKI